MKNHILPVALGAVCALWGAPVLVAGQGTGSTAKPEPPPAPSVQEQLDALKAGQERLAKELAELRALLQEREEKVAFAPAPPPPAKLITLNLEGEPFRGASNAAVAIVEYSDFTCPFCAKYVREVYPRIESEYLKPGKAKYFFRDLPVPGHTNALTVASAARCAAEQGKFWEMHDLLFAAQEALGSADLTAYAQGLGLDGAQFKQCLASRKYEQVIRRVALGADRLGLHGTPVFLIGTTAEDGTIVRATKVLLGGSDFEGLKAALDEVLAAQGGKGP